MIVDIASVYRICTPTFSYEPIKICIYTSLNLRLNIGLRLLASKNRPNKDLYNIGDGRRP